jgi:hypothetical protein
MMNLMHWRMVVAVADTGNITRAAERVGMTQSGASQAKNTVKETRWECRTPETHHPPAYNPTPG